MSSSTGPSGSNGTKKQLQKQIIRICQECGKPHEGECRPPCGTCGKRHAGECRHAQGRGRPIPPYMTQDAGGLGFQMALQPHQGRGAPLQPQQYPAPYAPQGYQAPAFTHQGYGAPPLFNQGYGAPVFGPPAYGALGFNTQGYGGPTPESQGYGGYVGGGQNFFGTVNNYTNNYLVGGPGAPVGFAPQIQGNDRGLQQATARIEPPRRQQSSKPQQQAAKKEMAKKEAPEGGVKKLAQKKRRSRKPAQKASEGRMKPGEAEEVLDALAGKSAPAAPSPAAGKAAKEEKADPDLLVFDFNDKIHIEGKDEDLMDFSLPTVQQNLRRSKQEYVDEVTKQPADLNLVKDKTAIANMAWALSTLASDHDLQGLASAAERNSTSSVYEAMDRDLFANEISERDTYDQ